MSEEIIWFTKRRKVTNPADVSLSLVKHTQKYGVNIIFRNGVLSDFKSDYIRFGASPKGDKVYFMASTNEYGYKLSKSAKGSTLSVRISESEIFDLVKRFIGDYTMGIDDDNHLFISKETRI